MSAPAPGPGTQEEIAAARKAYERAVRDLRRAEEAYDAALGYPASPSASG